MKKFKTYIFILLLALILIPFKVFAEDAKPATFTLNSSGTVKIGQTFDVTLSYTEDSTGVNTMSSCNLTISYDSNVLEYVSTSIKNASVSNGSIGVSNTGSVTFKVKSIPSSKSALIGLEGTAVISDEEETCSNNGQRCKVSSTSVKIAELGTDSKLSGLSIPNTTLSPAFNKNTYDYTADLKDVTSVEVKATASDPNAKVQISDNYKNLQKGENTISIVVTAENGKNKSTYKIKVNLELTPTEEELKLADASLTSLEIKDQKIEFNPEEVKYYLEVPYNITSLEITPKTTNENATFEISGNDKFIVGKNTVNIKVTAEDGTTTKTYSIIVTRLQQNKKIVQTCPDTTSLKEWIIFSVGLLLTFTLGIFLGYVLCKKGIIQKIFKKKEKQEEAVELQTLSDTIDLSDVVEEIKDDEDVKKA